MISIEQAIQHWEFARARTLEFIEKIEELDHPQEAIDWRPGPGRASIGWQLMHIAMTEEVFAHARLVAGEVEEPGLLERFGKGSVPDDQPVPLELIRATLKQGRSHLIETINTFEGTDLTSIPEPLQERGWSVEMVLQIIGWHEAHHQGQAHLTLNLYKQQF